MKKNIFVQSARFSHQRDTCTLLIVDLISKLQILNFHELFDQLGCFLTKRKGITILNKNYKSCSNWQKTNEISLDIS